MSNPFKVNGMGTPRIWMPGDAALPKSEIIPGETGQYRNLCGDMQECASGIWRRSPEDVFHSPRVSGAAPVGSVETPEILKTEGGRRELCMLLAKCHSEQSAIEVLKHYELWDDEALWASYGGIRYNHSTVQSQQPKPEQSLLEKITNALDAVLIAECLKQVGHPAGPGAPKSVRDAVRDFFRVRDGNIVNLTAVERQEIAQRILLMATGSKMHPCFTIMDSGSGQSPDRMPKTILSLHEGNKQHTLFMHGAHNQGGTGALVYCGDYSLQLVISRRDPDIAEERGEDDSWGFTIVRRFDPTDGRNSNYRYLTINGTDVPSFSGATALPLKPGDYPSTEGLPFTHGTFIKLYDYGIGRKLRTNIARKLASRLSALFPGIALPFLMLERRDYGDHRTEAVLAGLNVRLAEDKNAILDPKVKGGYSFNFSVDGEEFRGMVYVFAKGVAPDYINGEGVIYAVNGYAQGTEPRTFFGTRAVGLGILARSLLVVVDASNISTRAQEILFSGNRAVMRETSFKRRVTEKVAEQLRENEKLKALQNERVRTQVEEQVADDLPSKATLEKVLFKSPLITHCLDEGNRLGDPFKLTKNVEVPEFEGKKSPTMFQLKRKFPRTKPKKVALGKPAVVMFLTDAVNDYFGRSTDPGQLTVRINGAPVKDRDMDLQDGEARLKFDLPADVRVGDLIEVEWEVTDNYRADPFREEFYIKVVEAVERPKRTGKPRKKKIPSGKPGDGPKGKAELQLPIMREAGIGDYGFDKYSVMYSTNVNGEWIIFLNKDNIYLKTYLKLTPDEDPRIAKSRWKYFMQLTAIAAVKRYRELRANDEEEDSRMAVDEYLDEAGRQVAPIVLDGIEELGKIRMPDES